MDTQERLEILKDAREKISNEIEELKKEIENKKPKYWKPVNGETVWSWFHVFDIPTAQVYMADSDVQNNECAEGELFPTKELCIEHHKEKVYKERWKRLSVESGEDENPWDGVHKHWCVYYSINTGELVPVCSLAAREADTYFTSCRLLEKAIRGLGKDNVKRYILGIKE